ncbi:MAG: serine/threonine-protein kinase [Cyanobacteria bacterium J06621_15]
MQKQLGKNPGRKTLLAKDSETQELVVVKLISFDNDFDWQDLKLFERESQILEELSHSAIPNYLDSFKVDSDNSKGFGLVQTYIPAKSLEEHIQSGRTFTEAEVKQIAKALLEVLNYLHTRQPPVIHRDIKPGNILLGNRSGNHVGEVYLVDFGSVKTTAQQQGGTMTVVGTYGYMSQEQFGGRSVPASDLYSLGATLIYLVTGSHPADLLGDDMVIEFEESVNLSDEFINWLKWMTQTSLKKRPKSAEVALKELENPTVVETLENKLVVRKPQGSKVELRKDKDELEILIPPYGFSWGILVSCAFSIFWLNFAFQIPILFLKLLFVAVGISTFSGLLFSSFYKLFGYSILHINQDKIKLIYRIFGIKFRMKSISKRSYINKLEIVGRIIDKTTKGNPEIPPRLIIWAGKNKYELGKIVSPITINSSSAEKEYLTSPEIDWLAQELSDFLDLPISRDSVSIKN